LKQLPITTAEVWAVPVPMDAHDFVIMHNCIEWSQYHVSLSGLNHKIKGGYCNINIISTEYLGTATNDVIDFDASEIAKYNGCYDGQHLWASYTDPIGQDSAENSLRSAIQFAGYYFKNPYGSKPKILCDSENAWGIEQYNEWQAAQHNVIEKLVIIRKV